MANNKITLRKTTLNELYDLFFNSCNVNLRNKKARLFPSGNSNHENQTTSIFLSSLSAVKEFREELILSLKEKKIKAFNAELHTFTQISSEDNKDIPDGLIVVTTGKHEPVVEWACLIEAKIDKNPIETSQIKRYVNFGKKVGVNKLLTISNDLATNPNQSPLINQFSKVELRNYKLFHWSWTYLKVTAKRLINCDVIKDEDHVYILKELRIYFDNHTKLKNYTHMGKCWNEYSRIISNSRGRQPIKKACSDIANSYVQKEKDLALQLTDKSKQMHIELVANDKRLETVSELISMNKQVISTYMINGNKQNCFNVISNFIEQEIICLVNVQISKGKAISQTTQLINMMMSDSGVPDKIKIRAIYKYNKSNELNGKCSLHELSEQKNNPTQNNYSILDKSLGDTVKHFEVKIREKIGVKFFSPTIFITRLEEIAKQFLEQVMSNIKP